MLISYSKKRFSTFALLLLTATFFLIIQQFSIAQNETGTRSIYKKGCQYLGIWYDSTTKMFQERYPIIRSIPPISVNMPYDVLIGYIGADSLMRFTTSTQTDSLIDSWTTLNDTLKYAMKYLYEMEDYNPVIFRQYWDEEWQHQHPTIDSGAGFRIEFEDGFTMPSDSEPNIPTYLAVYTNDMSGLVHKLNVKFAHVIPNESEKGALFSLSEAHYILKVRILSEPDSVLSKYSTPSNPPLPIDYRYQAIAEVLDTIKGKVFNSYDLTGTQKVSVSEPQHPIIKIQYDPRIYWILGGDTDFGCIYQYPDSAFESTAGHFSFYPNQECVVFLVNESHFLDSVYDYYDFILEPRASVAALPIINGQVRDVNHIWSSETYLPYIEWRNRAEALINKIRTTNY